MKKVVIGCSVAFGIFALLLAFGVWLLFFNEQPVLNASMNLVSETTLNSTISLTITATNPHAKTVTLDSIDIYDSFLEGFQVVEVTPEAEDTMHIFFMRSWTFSQEVAPGESTSVTFLLKAVQTGRFSGDIDVCNPNADSKTLIADVIVKE